MIPTQIDNNNTRTFFPGEQHAPLSPLPPFSLNVIKQTPFISLNAIHLDPTLFHSCAIWCDSLLWLYKYYNSIMDDARHRFHLFTYFSINILKSTNHSFLPSQCNSCVSPILMLPHLSKYKIANFNSIPQTQPIRGDTRHHFAPLHNSDLTYYSILLNITFFCAKLTTQTLSFTNDASFLTFCVSKLNTQWGWCKTSFLHHTNITSLNVAVSSQRLNTTIFIFDNHRWMWDYLFSF